MQPLRSSPITEPSSLLRATPPLCSASVLSSSRFLPLATSPFASERQVLTFRTRARLSFAPPTCRMPLGQPSGQLPNLSRETGQPPVSTSSNLLERAKRASHIDQLATS